MFFIRYIFVSSHLSNCVFFSFFKRHIICSQKTVFTPSKYKIPRRQISVVLKYLNKLENLSSSFSSSCFPINVMFVSKSRSSNFVSNFKKYKKTLENQKRKINIEWKIYNIDPFSFDFFFVLNWRMIWSSFFRYKCTQ